MDLTLAELHKNPAASVDALLVMWPSRNGNLFRTHLAHSVIWNLLDVPEPDFCISAVNLPYLVRWV